MTWQRLAVGSEHGVKAALHDTDTRTSLRPTRRPTRTISRSYSCGKLNVEVSRHADILATILARVSVSWNVAFRGVVRLTSEEKFCTPTQARFQRLHDGRGQCESKVSPKSGWAQEIFFRYVQICSFRHQHNH